VSDDAGTQISASTSMADTAESSQISERDLPAGWALIAVSEAGAVDLGRQRHPDWHTGEHMRPYLRVANVFEDRIDIDDVMEMNFPPDVFQKFRLKVGDILLNEGQSPHLLGRPAMYVGSPPEVAFTNSLIRFRSCAAVLPKWALLVFRHHMHSGRFLKEVRITTNIAHLSANRFKSVEFPVPPLAEQCRITETIDEYFTRLDAAERSVLAALGRPVGRTSALRKALLRSAVSGELVDQDPYDEPAEILLSKIRAERGTSGPAKAKARARVAG
jgi:type I restriction enzyme S subunit